MLRSVEPEWLDALPADDPRAVRNRRDLRLMNRIMGHAEIIRRMPLAQLCTQAPRIAELGAGDGTLMLRVVSATAGWTRAEIVLVDRQPVVSTETLSRYVDRRCRVSVQAADVFDWLARQTSAYDAIVANLFLHHFASSQLAKLFTLAAACTKLFVACEPRRARLPLAASHMLGLIGCNDVTRHDAVLSVRAGFSGRELSRLWRHSEGWTLEEGRAGLFSHRFVAMRQEGLNGCS